MAGVSALARIVPSGNEKRDALARLQESDLPLVIYGMGGYARTLLRFLASFNVSVAAACVDEAYLTPDAAWNGLPVLSIERAGTCHERFNVLIGFSDFRKARARLQGVRGCNEVFFLDSTLGVDFFDYDYVKSRWDAFQRTYDLLEDERSRETFIAFINAKIRGRSEALYDLYTPDQYFPAGVVRLGGSEVFVDAGAYVGDTLRAFLKQTGGRYRAIYAFEPLEAAYRELERYVAGAGLANVRLFNVGVWKERGLLGFCADSAPLGERSFLSSAGEARLEVAALDDALGGALPSFVKMDVEGAELEAIAGAAGSIGRARPTMAVAAYHKPDDLMTIPAALRALVPGYRFYLRNHLHFAQELVLYAV